MVSVRLGMACLLSSVFGIAGCGGPDSGIEPDGFVPQLPHRQESVQAPVVRNKRYAIGIGTKESRCVKAWARSDQKIRRQVKQQLVVTENYHWDDGVNLTCQLTVELVGICKIRAADYIVWHFHYGEGLGEISGDPWEDCLARAKGLGPKQDQVTWFPIE